MSIENTNERLNNISGFPELPLHEQRVMEKIKSGIVAVQELWGYNPYESRLVEDKRMLEEKGIDGKELFTLNALHKGEILEKAEGQQVLALRFDLTVPLARFVGQNHKTLPFPLKRWQIQKVYRGETSRESHGRYCEFYQSDIDVVGKGTLSLIYDAEFPCIISQIFREVIGVDRFVIRINNRRLLEGLFEEFGMTDATRLKKAVKVIDNMEKVQVEDTTKALITLGLTVESASKILSFFNICRKSRPGDVVEAFAKLNVKNDLLRRGLDELTSVIRTIVQNGVPPEFFMVDPSIARGLDYYTGTVYETSMLDFPQLGSVCSGGRFDDLVGALSGDESLQFPGCGLSIGLSRLVPALIHSGILRADSMTSAPVLVAVLDEKYLDKYNLIASKLRSAGIATAVNYSGGRLKAQIEFAVKYGHKFILLGGEQEFSQNTIQVKEIKFQAKKTDSEQKNVFIDIEGIAEYMLDKVDKVQGYKTVPVPNDRQFADITPEDMILKLQACVEYDTKTNVEQSVDDTDCADRSNCADCGDRSDCADNDNSTE